MSPSPTCASTAAARRRSWRFPSRRRGSSTFCSTVSEGNRLKAWKTKPRRLRRSSVSSFSFIPVISVPPSRTDPADGRSSPAAHWRKVDLPEPDGPMIAVNVPRGRARSTPARACTAPAPRPYCRRTPRSSTAGPGAAASGAGRSPAVCRLSLRSLMSRSALSRSARSDVPTRGRVRGRLGAGRHTGEPEGECY
ncbi:hypothetical protein SPW_2769 [Streptomyces sp. W007]|nr:hypothetical protein SPW_2769 [Streptomyces sp. W007]